MKGFSRQLFLKHQHLKRAGSTTSASSDEEGVPVYSLEAMEASKHLDQWIDVELFLNVADLEPRSMKVRLMDSFGPSKILLRPSCMSNGCVLYYCKTSSRG